MHTHAKRVSAWLPSLVIVRSASDVTFLRNATSRGRLVPVLRVPGLPAELSREWESRLKSSLRECGCSLGAKCVIGALGASAAWQSLFSHWGAGRAPGFLLRTLLASFVAGMGGKLVGRARASARIQAIEKKLRDFQQRSSQEFGDVDMHKMGG